ncbi:hypothetical protein [Rickettsia canadensis]|uniref:Uncharacterized protein n=1 Tax=Rickettsia canadensis str. CA410 TaxID=1105107 RepID=A0ABM5MR50_RICCA|nr:hypothetical protein [Rickettsia canadensis]AFB20851.1 hypothetical protein RCA_01370 [Rickettsia canadensis str. CA410]
MVKTNDSYWAIKTIAKILTGEEKATDSHTVITIKTGNPYIVKAVIEKTVITYNRFKIARTTSIPEWLLCNSISSMDK